MSQARRSDPVKITLPPATGADRFSSKTATWLFIRDPKQLTIEKQAELELICQHSETARKTYALTQQFMSMLRLRRGQEFERWLSAVEASQIPELRRFAQGLRKRQERGCRRADPFRKSTGQSRLRSRSSNWSSARCLAAPNFLCYGNVYYMWLDLYRDFR
jgi:hypothetical protein